MSRGTKNKVKMEETIITSVKDKRLISIIKKECQQISKKKRKQLNRQKAACRD